MTNEQEGQEPGAEQSRPPGMEPDQHDESSVLEGAGDFTSGEGLVAFAGMVLVVVWLIFDIAIDSYGMSILAPFLALVAILLPRLQRETVERVAALPVLMKATGWALLLLGVLELIFDLRFNVYNDFPSILGALGAYAGYAMAFMGARQIEI